MKTSDRKNSKRLKALIALKEKSPERYEAEIDRLFQAWSEEAWRRVKNRELPPAGELIKVASQYGLGEEIAREVIEAVECHMGGPGFPSQSVIRPKADQQSDAIDKWEKIWGR